MTTRLLLASLLLLSFRAGAQDSDSSEESSASSSSDAQSSDAAPAAPEAPRLPASARKLGRPDSPPPPTPSAWSAPGAGAGPSGAFDAPAGISQGAADKTSRLPSRPIMSTNGEAAGDATAASGDGLQMPAWIAANPELAKSFKPLIGAKFAVYPDLKSLPEHLGNIPNGHGAWHGTPKRGVSVGMKYDTGSLRCAVGFSPGPWGTGGKKNNSNCYWNVWISAKGSVEPLTDCYQGAVMATDGTTATQFGFTSGKKNGPKDHQCYLQKGKDYFCNYIASGFERTPSPEQCDVVLAAPM